MIAWLGSILLGVKQPKEPCKSTMRMGALPCHSVSIRYLFFNFREFVTPRESYTRKVKKSKRPLGKHKHHSVSIGSSLFEFHHFHPLSRCCSMQLCLYSQHLATFPLSVSPSEVRADRKPWRFARNGARLLPRFARMRSLIA